MWLQCHVPHLSGRHHSVQIEFQLLLPLLISFFLPEVYLNLECGLCTFVLSGCREAVQKAPLIYVTDTPVILNKYFQVTILFPNYSIVTGKPYSILFSQEEHFFKKSSNLYFSFFSLSPFLVHHLLYSLLAAAPGWAYCYTTPAKMPKYLPLVWTPKNHSSSTHY